MFKRSDGLQSVRDIFGDTPCFITVGLCWGEWSRIRPSEGNFNLKTLGSGSSLGLGFALALPNRKVAVLDGDGAVVMNVNGLITVGRMQPKNLIHIVFDNKIYELSGCIPTATAYNLDLVAFAKAAGITKALRVDTIDSFRQAVKSAFETEGPHFIVATTQPSGDDATTAYSRIDEVDGKFCFVRFVEKLEGRKLREDAIDVRRSIN